MTRYWVLQYLKIFKEDDNIRNVVETSIKNSKVELKSVGKTLGEVKTNTDIFQADRLSPILFAITLIHLSILLRDMKAGYLLGEFREEN